jgi:hypothetical protein
LQGLPAVALGDLSEDVFLRGLDVLDHEGLDSGFQGQDFL